MLSSYKLHLNEQEKGIMDQSHYRKIPKIRPEVLFEGFIFGGAYIRREIKIDQNRLSFPYRWKLIYCFSFVSFCI